MLIANGIGAYFCLDTLSDSMFDRALFISPIVNMEQLIQDMMAWAGVNEEELCRRKEILTEFGETPSWKYLCYVREHPIEWSSKTDILYGEKDHLIRIDTVRTFAEKIGASLTVMPDGEHWFHAAEQMDFLDEWVQKRLKA